MKKDKLCQLVQLHWYQHEAIAFLPAGELAVGDRVGIVSEKQLWIGTYVQKTRLNTQQINPLWKNKEDVRDKKPPFSLQNTRLVVKLRERPTQMSCSQPRSDSPDFHWHLQRVQDGRFNYPVYFQQLHSVWVACTWFNGKALSRTSGSLPEVLDEIKGAVYAKFQEIENAKAASKSRTT